MGRTVIHIGFPKTGTTTLQSALRKTPGCRYVGKGLRDGLTPGLSLDLAEAVFFSDRRRFRELRGSLTERLGQAGEGASCLVVSDEAFTFAEFMAIGRKWGRQVVTDHEDVADRLAQLLGDATVLMSVREQRAFLRSFHDQTLKRGRDDTPLDTFVQTEIDHASHRSMLGLLRYEACLEAYEARFGAGNVHVSVFEQDRSDYEGYIARVADICGLPADGLLRAWGGGHENTGRPENAGPGLRAARQIVPATVRRMVPNSARSRLAAAMSPPPKPDLSEAHGAWLAEHFAASNAALGARTGLDLARWGYAVA